MDKEEKPSISRVALAAMRLLGPKLDEKPKHPVSERRMRTRLINMILQNCSFPTKQQKLLKALAQKGWLDSHDIRIKTGSRAPRRLVYDTRKTIKSSQFVKETIDIGRYRKGTIVIYQLRIPPIEK